MEGGDEASVEFAYSAPGSVEGIYLSAAEVLENEGCLKGSLQRRVVSDSVLVEEREKLLLEAERFGLEAEGFGPEAEGLGLEAEGFGLEAESGSVEASSQLVGKRGSWAQASTRGNSILPALRPRRQDTSATPFKQDELVTSATTAASPSSAPAAHASATRGPSRPACDTATADEAPSLTADPKAGVKGWVAKFSVGEELENSLEVIDSVIPNFRDISVSSCCAAIKPNVLFRSARPFGKYKDVERVFRNILQIKTVLDLRDDNLTGVPEECASRLILSKLYRLYSITHSSDAVMHPFPGTSAFPVNSAVSPPPSDYQPTAPTDLRALATWLGAAPRRLRYRAPVDPPLESDVHACCEKLLAVCHDLPEPLAKQVVTTPHTFPLYQMLIVRDPHKIGIINILDAPAVKRKVFQRLSRSKYLPLVALAKAADVVHGTNHIAPYYFCKFIISAHELEDTYFEMLDGCGRNLFTSLVLIALSEPPILFHCTLGKDRTGILSMLLLHILGATEQAIIFDYYLTERANAMYQQYNRKFVVEMCGMPEKFCGASVSTMRLTLDYVKAKYGSIDEYLDHIGFDSDWRRVIRKKFLKA